MIRKTQKLIAIINLVGFSHYVFTIYLEVNAAFSKENVNENFALLWKSGKIRSCHGTYMTSMGQSCNNVPAAMYRIEAAVRNGFTNPSCTSTLNQWHLNCKDIQPLKIKDMNFGCEDFCQQGKKKQPLVSSPKKKHNPHS